MATHTMNINALSFGMIQEGKKTLEVRLNKDGVESYAAGDTLVVRNRETGEDVQKTINTATSYLSLKELLEHEDFRQAGSFETADGFIERIRSFQTEQDEEQYGLVAIHLK